MALKIAVNPSKAQLFQEFKRELGVNSDAEVVNHALSVLQWVLKHRRNGLVIAAVDKQNRNLIELQLGSAVAA